MTQGFFDSQQGQIIISIIWGLLVACLFNLSCKKKKTIMLDAPNPELLKSHVVKFNDSCYHYDKVKVECKKEGNIKI
jgi:hypothetical protein